MTRIFYWFFMWKMGPMSGFDILPVFTLPPRDSTLQFKRCVHLWNNFPCIITLACIMFSLKLWVVNIKILMMSFYPFYPYVLMIFSNNLEITNKQRSMCSIEKWHDNKYWVHFFKRVKIKIIIYYKKRVER